MTLAVITMPRYERYKDSGIDWIGDIPEDWKSNRFRFLSRITTGERNTEDKNQDGSYPFFVRSQTPEKINSYSYDGEAVLTAGDGAGVGKVYHYINGKFDYHQRVYMFSQFKEVIGKYIFYYLSSNFYNVALLGSAKSTVDSLRLPLIQNFLVTFPNKNEQIKIINFLDKKTTQIDQAIKIKEQQIALLKERKQIIIQNAVTKGLDPNVPMKDSGVDWIGEIPAHWEVALVKHTLSKLGRPRKQNGNTVICSNNGCSKLLGDNKQGLVSLTQHDYQGVNKGDLLVHGMDIWHGAISVSEYEGDCTSVVHVCDSIHMKGYIAYFLKMLAIMNVYKLISNGVRQNTSDFRSWKKFGDIQVVLPPKEEQQSIMKFLDEQAKKMNQVVDLAQEQILQLKEYKSSLINSAVTGKMKVI